MVTALLASVAVFAAALLLGFGLERRLGSDATLEALPWYLQLLVGGLSIAPLTYLEAQFTVGPADGLVVAFAISAVCWVSLPALLSRLVDYDETATPQGC
ncbi:MAG: hypothetical protein J07HX5_00116 [halophilic archaeon J07HX5]|jgi:hypothetical protein|nr:MAG: hypothetical protein J07HX5_00116 [halophilic archaeon J07HX5]